MGFFSRLFGRGEEKSKSGLEFRRGDDYPLGVGPRLTPVRPVDPEDEHGGEPGPVDDLNTAADEQLPQ